MPKRKNPAAVALGKRSAKSPKRTAEYYKRLSQAGNLARWKGRKPKEEVKKK